MEKQIENIQDCEDAVESGLEILEQMNLSNAEVARALRFLAPEGLRPVVEFRESGRKKRRTASADNRTPETGEILITFGPAEAVAPLVLDRSAGNVNTSIDQDLKEVWEALAEAEVGR
jgi:hypothetical protein